MSKTQLKVTGAVLIAALLIGAPSVRAQMTIGANLDPNEGSLLDLKTSDESVNATKGLLLPRVQLTDLTKLSPMFNGSYDPAENAKHVGLTVYHVHGCPVPIPSGIYVWDGSEWKPLRNGGSGGSNVDPGSPGDVGELKDGRDGEIYRTGNFGTAGVWMLENLRYIPTAADYT
ncbi:MAG: hypothetical protein LBH12_03265, partial [Dysgonamonadaceae bacterium]|nr:hypothetical protein [Dysgonamonadaceae bacterium]